MSVFRKASHLPLGLFGLHPYPEGVSDEKY